MVVQKSIVFRFRTSKKAGCGTVGGGGISDFFLKGEKISKVWFLPVRKPNPHYIPIQTKQQNCKNLVILDMCPLRGIWKLCPLTSFLNCDGGGGGGGNIVLIDEIGKKTGATPLILSNLSSLVNQMIFIPFYNVYEDMFINLIENYQLCLYK